MPAGVGGEKKLLKLIHRQFTAGHPLCLRAPTRNCSTASGCSLKFSPDRVSAKQTLMFHLEASRAATTETGLPAANYRYAVHRWFPRRHIHRKKRLSLRN
jgi:hypothetical protein